MHQEPRATDHTVAVVGAGPAGLVTAVMLAHQDVDVLVLERRSAVSDLPRAVGITMRQMELFRAWGLEERVLAGGDDVDLALLETCTAAEAHAGTRRELNVPTRTQSAVVSPTAPARVPQDHLERVLMEHLLTLPRARVLRSVELVDVEQDDQAVHLHVRQDDTLRSISADYLVGADGARSTVRACMGIEMVGPDDMMAGIGSEIRADLWPILGEHRYALYTITHPDGTGVLIPAGQGDRWQFGVVLRDGDDPEALAQHEALRRRVRAAAGVPDLEVEIVRVSPFWSGAQLADRFSEGRVFLVGDAAHRVTPRGGNGLAMAIRDGLDLGWRLTWVTSGWARPSFLTTYEAETRPVSADSVARAADPDGFCRAVISEMLLDLGGRVQHAWVRPGVSTLDLLGPGVTLFVTDQADAWADAARAWTRPVPMTLAPLPPSAAHALGLHRPGGAMLVRPDGVSVSTWWSSSDHAGDLDRAVDALLRPATRPPGSGLSATELDQPPDIHALSHPGPGTHA